MVSESRNWSDFRRLLSADLVRYGIFGALSKLLVFASVPILARAFDPAQLGLLALVVALSALLTVVFRWELNSALMRLFHEVGAPGRLALSCLALVGAFTVVMGGVALVASPYIADWLLGTSTAAGYVVLAVLLAGVQAIAEVPRTFLRMERRVLLHNSISLMRAVFHLALIAVAALQNSLWLVVLSFVIASSVELVALLAIVGGAWEWQSGESHVSGLLTYATPLVPTVLLRWGSEQIDRVVLAILLGLAAAGLFDIAAKVALPLMLIVQVFAHAWVPLSLELVSREHRSWRDVHRRILSIYAFLGGVGVLGVAALGPELLSLVAGRNFLAAWAVVPWLAGAVALRGAANITAVGLVLQKRTGLHAWIAALGLLANVVLLVALVPIFGLNGAGIGAFVAEAVFVCGLLVGSHVLCGSIFNGGEALRALILVAGSVAVIILLPLENVWSRDTIYRVAISAGGIVLLAWNFQGSGKTRKAAG